jgi:hypothetical protein
MKRKLFVCIGLLGIVIIFLIYTIIFIKNSVLSAVISTLMGSAITFFITLIYEILQSGFSQFTGYYRDEISTISDPTNIIKRDKFQLIEKNGNILSGDFTRYVPQKSKYTNWKCSGFIVLDQFLLSYRAVSDTTPSRGIILVKLDTSRTNGLLPCYSGMYYKFEGEHIIGHRINLIKIEKEEYESL